MKLLGEWVGGTARDGKGREIKRRCGCCTRLDARDGRALDQQGNGDRIEHLSCGAHPGAQYRAVSGFVMMGVMSLVWESLRRSKAADSKQANDQQDSERLLE